MEEGRCKMSIQYPFLLRLFLGAFKNPFVNHIIDRYADDTDYACCYAERHHHCLLEYRHKQITEIYCCGFQDQHNKSGSHHIERCDLLVIISEYSKDKIIIVYLFYIITASPINVIAPAIFPVAGTLNGASAI